jgi:DNA-binding MarR family transcriptional regulator
LPCHAASGGPAREARIDKYRCHAYYRDVPGKALRELKQSKPFPSLHDEALINIQITADVHLRRITEVLKPFGLSPAQYNVLRILRGSGAKGLPSGEIGERMVNRDPDVTRLLDRLEARGLVSRSRSERDRRVVTVRATGAALQLLRQTEEPLHRLIQGLFPSFSDQKLSSLISLLEESR